MVLDFEIPDMAGWSDKKRAKWYEAHADDIEEIFGGEKATFIFDPDTTMTTREIPMTLREAKRWDIIEAHYRDKFAREQASA